MFFLCKGGWIPKLPCWSCVMDVPIQILLSGEICKKCLWMQNAVDCQSLPGFFATWADLRAWQDFLQRNFLPVFVFSFVFVFLSLWADLLAWQEFCRWTFFLSGILPLKQKYESSRNVSFQRSLANLVSLKNSPTKVPNLMFQKIGWFWFSVKHFKLVGSQVSLRVVPYVFSHLAG